MAADKVDDDLLIRQIIEETRKRQAEGVKARALIKEIDPQNAEYTKQMWDKFMQTQPPPLQTAAGTTDIPKNVLDPSGRFAQPMMGATHSSPMERSFMPPKFPLEADVGERPGFLGKMDILNQLMKGYVTKFGLPAALGPYRDIEKFVKEGYQPGREQDPRGATNAARVGKDLLGTAALRMGEPGSIGMLQGPKSRLADKDALEVARKLVKEGAPADAIWHETGWGKGADQGWRSILPGSQHSQVNLLDRAPRNTRLPDIWQYPELYSAYPGAKDIKVKEDPGLGNAEGAFSIKNNEMSFRPGGLSKSQYAGMDPSVVPMIEQARAANLRNYLAHESQHYVAGQEGFNPGFRTDALFNNRYLQQKYHPELQEHIDDYMKWARAQPTYSPQMEGFYLNRAIENAMTKVGERLYKTNTGENDANVAMKYLHMSEAEKSADPFWSHYGTPMKEQNQDLITPSRGFLGTEDINDALQMAGKGKPGPKRTAFSDAQVAQIMRMRQRMMDDGTFTEKELAKRFIQANPDHRNTSVRSINGVWHQTQQPYGSRAQPVQPTQVGSDVPTKALDMLPQQATPEWLQQWAESAGVPITSNKLKGEGGSPTRYMHLESSINDKPVVVRFPGDEHMGRPVRGETGRRFDTGTLPPGSAAGQQPNHPFDLYGPGTVNASGQPYANTEALDMALRQATGKTPGSGDFSLVSPDYAPMPRQSGPAFQDKKIDPNKNQPYLPFSTEDILKFLQQKGPFTGPLDA